MSTVQRFFVEPSAIDAGAVRFTRDQAHQMGSVLRLQPGAIVVALDNSGWQYRVKIERLTPQGALGKVAERSLVTTEPRTKITLYAALIRPNRWELVLQKCTELGASAFVPVLTQRCVVGQADDGGGRLERWNRIVAEAAEQSARGKLPPILATVPFDQACDQVRGLSLLLSEQERERRLKDVLAEAGAAGRPFSVNVFVGPEGGFTDAEVARAREAGMHTVGLGARILRAETASIAATTAILFAQSDLG